MGDLCAIFLHLYDLNILHNHTAVNVYAQHNYAAVRITHRRDTRIWGRKRNSAGSCSNWIKSTWVIRSYFLDRHFALLFRSSSQLVLSLPSSFKLLELLLKFWVSIQFICLRLKSINCEDVHWNWLSNTTIEESEHLNFVTEHSKCQAITDSIRKTTHTFEWKWAC